MDWEGLQHTRFRPPDRTPAQSSHRIIRERIAILARHPVEVSRVETQDLLIHRYDGNRVHRDYRFKNARQRPQHCADAEWRLRQLKNLKKELITTTGSISSKIRL